MNTKPSTDSTFTAVLQLPCCRLGVRTNTNELSELVFLAPNTPLQSADSTLIQSLESAISSWLNNPHYLFNFPVSVKGTAFQQRTWQAISRIPSGTVRTYGEICAEVGGTPRAVGQACGANPFPIIVPCHRVVAKAGLGGFANAREGWLLDTKRWLLKHEGML